MPKKSSREITVADAPRSLTRTMAGGGELVQVDAVFHVPAVHPAGSGPWSEEADKISWTDMPTGYGCIMRRSPLGKHLAGYVSVPPGHPLFGRGTGSLDDLLIGVHGGIDYAAACRASEPEEVSICHPSGREERERIVSRSSRQTVYENEAAKAHADAWWFGFSCNQIGDVLPEASYGHQKRQERLIGGTDPVYRTEAYVYRECVRLAAQLKAIEEGRDPRDADPGPSASSHDPYRTRG
ncbi:hypothetical protein [Sphingomonas carotinifaciens]|uniref:Uncharacterized protein n=1 Tax=Sphingomonas carotinifaciens TaxID=1166323 RepID=A0A1G7RT91_9SPHN|nr:hypothetical protein [Sphingomonas carotinifaciens]MBB4088133.1 hypothetical protein [Sphingomonas carotinifaciens]MWC43816.1 hypothetical protein [Sphingomonas carotinifaciens]SDG14077.1 hypothetical protein SAMN05216557_11420 [Sphingomonas carotinifaciens]